MELTFNNYFNYFTNSIIIIPNFKFNFNILNCVSAQSQACLLKKVNNYPII